MSLHLNEIIDIYEQSRPWYDEKPSPQTTKKVAGLKGCLGADCHCRVTAKRGGVLCGLQ